LCFAEMCDYAHISLVVRTTQPIDVSRISRSIINLRGQRVILDRDLAMLYGVSTSRLNEAVKRNASRFPSDFMFKTQADEAQTLMSQFATSNVGRGGNRKLPWVFTEHGAIQAANVLNSPRAIEMGVHVVRAFVRLRELLASNKALARKLDELEHKYRNHDSAIANILATIRQFTDPPVPRSRGIGFTANIDESP
jgi:hypothetical protein